MRRREFLKAGLASGLPALVPGSLLADPAPRPRKGAMVGVQISPHSLLDEGIERCLDHLREKAAVNTLFLYPHTYHMGYRPPEVMAHDHGVKVRDLARRKLPRVWVRHSPSRFEKSIVRHPRIDSSHEYGDRDVFAETIPAARSRGMRVFARILEAGARRKEHIPGYEKVLTVDLDGKPGRGPCWNHPAYREWVYQTVRDVIELHPVDGFQYGAERTGPLSNLLFRGWTPTCFCEHCVKRNRARGIDVEGARAGFEALRTLVRTLEAGKKGPPDGVITSVIRALHRHPDTLAWDYQWFQADEEICREVHRISKSTRPGIESGRHVDHQRSSWDIFFRSALTYGEMAEEADFIKPILYHEILGPRLRWWVLERMKQRVLSELTLEQSLDLFYSLFGHDRARQPDLENLEERGLGVEYVYRETLRVREGVGDRARVYSGIGIDVPWYVPGGMEARPSSEAAIRGAVHRAFDAGADGILASREYDEMTFRSLEVFGKAIRERTS